MVSVTSEVASTLSFQNTQRAQKSDAPANDSFASLVDSNTAAADDGRADPPPANNNPAPRRQDDSAAAANTRPRDGATSDKPARNDSADRDTAPVEQAKSDADAKPDQAGRSKSKSKDARADETKSVSRPDSEETVAADGIEKEQDAATETSVDALAVAITIPVAQTETPVVPTTAAPGGSAPLAIAAAAIAAAASVTGTDAPASASDGTAAIAATAASATGADAPATGQQIAAADVAGDPALSAAVAAPVLAKSEAAPKTPSSAKDAPARTGEPGMAASIDTPADPSTAPAPAAVATQPAATDGKPGAQHAATDALKSDAAANAFASANGAAHGHPQGADTMQTPANPQNNGVQTLATVQPQLQPAAAQATPQFTVTAATQAAAVPLSGLAMEIAASARSGKSRFEIRLDPAELGRIDVRIDVDRNGQVTSHLTVEKPETLQMLRQDANQLHRALNDAGLSTNGGGLQFSLRDQSSSGQNEQNQSNPNAQRLIVSEEEAMPAAVASYGRMFGPSGGVDIRI